MKKVRMAAFIAGALLIGGGASLFAWPPCPFSPQWNMTGCAVWACEDGGDTYIDPCTSRNIYFFTDECNVVSPDQANGVGTGNHTLPARILRSTDSQIIYTLACGDEYGVLQEGDTGCPTYVKDCAGVAPEPCVP